MQHTVAQIDADLAQLRFMLVDPNNRLVADTLEGEWNEKVRVLAKARREDVTLIKMPAEGTTKIHVRFKGGVLPARCPSAPNSLPIALVPVAFEEGPCSKLAE